MSKTDIYYFSGTGNSLFAARELALHLPDCRIIPMVGAFNEGQTETDADVLGLIFPVHALTTPILVKRFLKTLRIKSAAYVFAVATRGGTVYRGFPALSRAIDRARTNRTRKGLDAAFTLTVLNNESRQQPYSAESTEEIEAVRQRCAEELELIAGQINARQSVSAPKGDDGIPMPFGPIRNALIEGLVLGAMRVAPMLGGPQYFYHDDTCNGCGICAKVCLSQKIQMQTGQPVWNKNTMCFMCYACLNYCPQQSVQIKDIPGVKSLTETNDRYPHPFATAQEITAQRHLKTIHKPGSDPA